jgi:hypothetical protein
LYSPAAHLLAGVLFILCLGLVVSGHMPVPEPFDLALVKSASSR